MAKKLEIRIPIWDTKDLESNLKNFSAIVLVNMKKLVINENQLVITGFSDKDYLYKFESVFIDTIMEEQQKEASYLRTCDEKRLRYIIERDF